MTQKWKEEQNQQNTFSKHWKQFWQIQLSFTSLACDLIWSPLNKENLPATQETQVQSLGWQQPTPVLLPGESHGQRSLLGYGLWGGKESDTTEQLNNSKTKNIPCNFSKCEKKKSTLIFSPSKFLSHFQVTTCKSKFLSSFISSFYSWTKLNRTPASLQDVKILLQMLSHYDLVIMCFL